MCFRVVVHLDSPLENEKVYMHVLDINHNERVYKIICNYSAPHPKNLIDLT